MRQIPGQHVITHHRGMACGVGLSMLLAIAGTSASGDDNEALRQELLMERQKVAAQMLLLEQQMADYQRQVQRINDLEKRLDAGEGAGSGNNDLAATENDIEAASSAPAEPMHFATIEAPVAGAVEQGVDSGLQILAAEGRSAPANDDSFAKSVALFGTPWRFSFGGYAKVDLLYDFSGTGNKQEFVLATIPVDDNPPQGSYSNLQASETRFHFESRNSSPGYASNRLYLEFDFFDEQNTTATRLRHAYFEYGKLLGGRTWTLLTELRQLPLILDFAAGDSILGGRTEQIRWTTANEKKTFGWAMAVEKFDDSAIYNPLDFQGTARSDFPRLTGGFTKIWERVVWSAGGALTQLRFDGSGATKEATDLAYTVTTAGRVYFDGSQQNWLGYGIGYQVGSVTDVITFANGRVSNAALDEDGDLDLAKSWNTQIGLHWNWNQDFSSNFSFAYAHLTDVPELFLADPDIIRTGGSYHANLIYKYNPLLTGGIELMHGERENVSGRNGNAQRLQMSVMYNF